MESKRTYVAVKEVNDMSNFSEETASKLFLHEVKLLQFVNHRNIVKLLGLIIAPRLSIISEFIEGESLDKALKRGMTLG